MSDARGSTDGYQPLTVATAIEYLGGTDAVIDVLGADTNSWSVTEIGDGNLNLVFKLQSDKAAIIAKQALPYIRARGEKWQLPLTRAFFEYEALQRHSQRAPGTTPRVLHFDKRMALIVMEYLSPHIILRKGLVRGQLYPDLARDMGLFLAQTLFRGSGLSLSPTEMRADVDLFAENHALCAVTEARVFTEPYVDAELNRWTSPQLDDTVSRIRADDELKSGIREMLAIYKNKSQALLHGDLHSGSVMVTQSDTRVIDPEFAFCGPMGFDIGALLANYLIAFIAQPAHATAANDRIEYSRWMLETIAATWNVFAAEFARLWHAREASGGRSDNTGSARMLPDYLAEVFTDSLGFAAAKMLRRVIGAAHVEDLESIPDPDVRAACEKQVIALARLLLLKRQELTTIEAVIALAQDFHER